MSIYQNCPKKFPFFYFQILCAFLQFSRRFLLILLPVNLMLLAPWICVLNLLFFVKIKRITFSQNFKPKVGFFFGSFERQLQLPLQLLQHIPAEVEVIMINVVLPKGNANPLLFLVWRFQFIILTNYISRIKDFFFLESKTLLYTTSVS